MNDGATTDGQKWNEVALTPGVPDSHAPSFGTPDMPGPEIVGPDLISPALNENDAAFDASPPSAFHSDASHPFTAELPSFTRLTPVYRTPNLADALLFLLMLVVGFLATAAAASLAAHYHLFGLRNMAQAQSDTRLALATQALLYGVALACAIPFFRMAWGKGLLDGLHWHGATAKRLRFRLLGTAVVCNVIAMLGNAVLPFPQHAPIDKMFSTSTDAWLLMAFGITVAPFFEEMAFRGFLLPAMATAWDWCSERLTRRLPRTLDAEGNPRWSLGAMIFAALTVSAPFALMHAEQVGNAWGPVLLLYCVSLILCTVRLATRSLAASTLVHASYNFMLFAVMFAETDGFRHLDKM